MNEKSFNNTVEMLAEKKFREMKFEFVENFLAKHKTKEFDKWLRKLNDLKAKAKILFRIQKLEKDGKIIVLLSRGDKSTQERDLKKSKEIWKKLNE
jgi:putative component of toxin-antitoxin plasmid stabilization module